MEVWPSIAQMNQLVLLRAGGGVVESLPDGGQRLSIPAGAAGEYRLAQLDDTQNLPRSEFHWQSPCMLELRARVSAADAPGTWGFGLWNDPFAASLGMGGGTRKLPVFPDAVWFFHASSANWLSLRDDLPANGFWQRPFAAASFPPPYASGSPGNTLVVLEGDGSLDPPDCP